VILENEKNENFKTLGRQNLRTLEIVPSDAAECHTPNFHSMTLRDRRAIAKVLDHFELHQWPRPTMHSSLKPEPKFHRRSVNKAREETMVTK
jgi:hypothetical protein